MEYLRVDPLNPLDYEARRKQEEDFNRDLDRAKYGEAPLTDGWPHPLYPAPVPEDLSEEGLEAVLDRGITGAFEPSGWAGLSVAYAVRRSRQPGQRFDIRLEARCRDTRMYMQFRDALDNNDAFRLRIENLCLQNAGLTLWDA